MLALESSEQMLIARASNGDLDAFNELVLSYQDLAFRYACGLVHDPDAAEDVTQESFIKVFQSIRSFRGGSFRAWLLKIVTNTAHDAGRRISRHPTISLFPLTRDEETLESPLWLMDGGASVEATVQSNEEMRYVSQYLDELPEAFRSVITLVDICELDYVETAQILHVPLGTVKSRLARARLQLKNKLQSAAVFSLQNQECLSVVG